MQNTAWDLACRSGNARCISEMNMLFNETMKSCSGNSRTDSPCNMIPLNLRNVAYCNAMMNVKDNKTADAHYDFMLKKYEIEINNNERLALLYGLSCAKYEKNVDE